MQSIGTIFIIIIKKSKFYIFIVLSENKSKIGTIYSKYYENILVFIILCNILLLLLLLW